jgi:hypothetical protein
MDFDKEQDELWNQQKLCQILGISVKTAATWRSKRVGPAYLKVGGAIRYRPKDVFYTWKTSVSRLKLKSKKNDIYETDEPLQFGLGWKYQLILVR